MLIVAKNLEQLNFPELMKIYVEGNREHGEEMWPEKTEEEQLRLSEQDFLLYLRERFFTKPEAMYLVWEAEGHYVSALRLEPNRDGLLLEALETVPEERCKGYAVSLITAAKDWLAESGKITLYSHVSKRNEASLKTHMRCGFEIYLDHTVYSDGSRNDNAHTLRCMVGK